MNNNENMEAAYHNLRRFGGHDSAMGHRRCPTCNFVINPESVNGCECTVCVCSKLKDNIETSSMCISGSVTQVQVYCKEMPYFVNNNGDIAFREPHNVIFYMNSHQSAVEVCKGLNAAFKAGYEQDRVEWKTI